MDATQARERLNEHLRHGKRVNVGNVSEWAADLERRRDEWRARTPNWRELMLRAGLDPDHD